MRERWQGDWARIERDCRILERVRKGDLYKQIAYDEKVAPQRVAQLAVENGLRRRRIRSKARAGPVATNRGVG